VSKNCPQTDAAAPNRQLNCILNLNTCLPIQAGYHLYKERRIKLLIDSGINRKRKREEAQS
jgi:hypothetical protein